MNVAVLACYPADRHRRMPRSCLEPMREQLFNMCRGVINMSEGMWDALTDKQRAKIMAKELWLPENEAKYRESQRIVSDDFDD